MDLSSAQDQKLWTTRNRIWL